ncbi:hypothetical protein CTAYLR_001698 [Chrysophaeum taylorii]|uniref:Uncharacterized protein n=1 Tax=Chrysophaeum taylorii TaxID=2483200 RepID=A0AAD7U6A1_9STRA|nr:hypothetical protein CTAYLR_001698 [Chrysophaeum taylorii]
MPSWLLVLHVPIRVRAFGKRSAVWFRYFGCRKFDRGAGKTALNALLIDPDLRCAGERYAGNLKLVLLMIFVWPVGVPLGFAVLLWRYRHEINPKIDEARSAYDRYASSLGFESDRRRFFESVKQSKKIDIREKNESIKWLEFLYEEYEPRCMYFPLLELGRRIFLTGVLGMLHPGSPSQIYVGLLSAGILYKIYLVQAPYIVDSDDMVSEAAQTQAVILSLAPRLKLYFAALIVYASNEMGHKQGIFDSTIFGTTLILLYSSSFLFAVWYIMLDIFGYNVFRNFFKKKEEDDDDDQLDQINSPASIDVTNFVQTIGGDGDDAAQNAPAVSSQYTEIGLEVVEEVEVDFDDLLVEECSDKTENERNEALLQGESVGFGLIHPEG